MSIHWNPSALLNFCYEQFRPSHYHLLPGLFQAPFHCNHGWVLYPLNSTLYTAATGDIQKCKTCHISMSHHSLGGGGNLSNLLPLNLPAWFSTAFHQKCVVLRMPNSACHAMPLHPRNLCCGYSLYQELPPLSDQELFLIHEPSEPADFSKPYLEQVPILCDSIIPCSYLLFIKGWIIVKL